MVLLRRSVCLKAMLARPDPISDPPYRDPARLTSTIRSSISRFEGSARRSQSARAQCAFACIRPCLLLATRPAHDAVALRTARRARGCASWPSDGLPPFVLALRHATSGHRLRAPLAELRTCCGGGQACCTRSTACASASRATEFACSQSRRPAFCEGRGTAIAPRLADRFAGS